jgi:predicted transposase/invertase (TIGR01784 family)
MNQEEGIAMASEVLMTISRDENERFRLLSEEKYILDTQSNLAYERKQGRAEGRAEGRTEGRTEEKLAIARKMKKAGRPFSEIAEFTGLTEEEVISG